MSLDSPAIIPQRFDMRRFEDAGHLISTPSKHPTLTTAVENTGTVTLESGGGWKILSSATGDHSVVHSDGNIFKLNPSTSGTPTRMTAHQDYAAAGAGVRFDPSDGATWALMGVYIGISDKTTTMILDTTALLLTDFDGAGFYKEAAVDTLRIVASNATAQTKLAITAANGFSSEAVAAAARALTSTSTVQFLVTMEVTSQTACTIKWWIDGVFIHQIKDFTLTSLLAMKWLVGIKAISTPDEIVYLDNYTQVAVRGDASLVTA